MSFESNSSQDGKLLLCALRSDMAVFLVYHVESCPILFHVPFHAFSSLYKKRICKLDVAFTSLRFSDLMHFVEPGHW